MEEYEDDLDEETPVELEAATSEVDELPFEIPRD